LLIILKTQKPADLRGDHAGSKSGEIAKKLAIPNPTVKRLLSELMTRNLIEKHGLGAGTNYSLK